MDLNGQRIYKNWKGMELGDTVVKNKTYLGGQKKEKDLSCKRRHQYADRKEKHLPIGIDATRRRKTRRGREHRDEKEEKIKYMTG